MGTQPVNASLGVAGDGAGGGGGEISEEAAAGITKTPDGKTIMRARTARQLMTHIARTLVDNDAELFADQVLSRASRQEFIDRGMDPKEAFARAMERRKDIGKLFKRMPMGEHTPFVMMEKIGDKVYRVELTGRAGDELEYRGFDMVLEGSFYKLRWFF